MQPWGLKGLEARYYHQLSLSNVLLQVALRFFLKMVKVGGFSLIEHPATMPDNAFYGRARGASSIWNLAYLKWLQKFPQVNKLV